MGIFEDGVRLVYLIVVVSIGVWLIATIGTALGQNTSLYTGLLILIAIVAVFVFIKKGLDL
jgi:hypothetical protein